jgi:NAD(P)H-hydrate epimerase
MHPTDHSADPLVLPPSRADQSHKGDYGRVLVVAGSRDMAGAAGIVGLATLRSGAGLVTVATSRSAQPVVASYSPCYTTAGLEESTTGRLAGSQKSPLETLGAACRVWAIGPGLGQADDLRELVVGLYREVPVPMVVDADALNALAIARNSQPDLFAHPAGPRILTPHPGEFSRLTELPIAADERERAERAAALCRSDPSGRTLVVLKGHRTVIAEARRYATNSTGNPGMATGGSGDCLTGVIAGLLAQGLAPWDAARLGVHAHGLAGDLAANVHGQIALIATDLIEHLGSAFEQVGRRN